MPCKQAKFRKKNVENRTFQLLSIGKLYFFQYFLGGVRVSLTDCCSIFKTEKNGLGTRAANDRREVQYTQKSCKLR